MFGSIYFGPDESWAARLYFVFVAFLFFFFVGAAVAAVCVRWRQRGLIAFFAVLTLVVVGGAALITALSGWESFAGFFGRIGFAGGFTLALVPTVLAGIAGYLILRRATPRT